MSLLFWVYVMFQMPWDLRRSVRLNYRVNQRAYLETRVSLDEDGIDVENEAHQYSLQWQEARVIAATPEGLLFCDLEMGVLFWLPRRVFEGDGPRQEHVLRLAASKGVPVRHLS